ncbi:acetolactate synthase small subunit [Candidatus Calescamantes bacterium]|nr:acetolactate synthase small subunit [Candidatus Calescamantes bacterium]
MRRVISVLVENKFGVLSRIAALFAARGFNIESLSVAETDDPSISRMTIVVTADERVLEQVVKQLRRLIDVIKVEDITEKEHVERELVLVKVKSSSTQRGEIIELTNIFRGKIVDVSANTITIEITGAEGKIKGFLSLLKNYGIKELIRTGKVAISRGG